MNTVFGTLGTLFICIKIWSSVFIMMHYEDEDDAQFNNASKIGLIINYWILYFLGLVFLVYGILTICALKKFFPSFYNQNLCALISATLILSIPITLRASSSLLLVQMNINSTNFYYKFPREYIMVYIICFYVICELIPGTT